MFRLAENQLKFRIIHHADQNAINSIYAQYCSVFILSTGRSGSKFLASLLNLAPNIDAYHEPRPTLQYFSNYAYHNQKQKETLRNMIHAARMEQILEAHIHNKVYVESNQCLTFFAPVISSLFMKSKFVHVVRHPGNFVRSAIRKGWHVNDSIWESGRVRMTDDGGWTTLDQLEKLAWVWLTTNRFLENFKKGISAERSMTLRIENLYAKTNKVQELLSFVGAEAVPLEQLIAVQKTRINEFRKGADEPPNIMKVVHFPEYQDWTLEAKGKLRKYCQELADKYGYEL